MLTFKKLDKTDLIQVAKELEDEYVFSKKDQKNLINLITCIGKKVNFKIGNLKSVVTISKINLDIKNNQCLKTFKDGYKTKSKRSAQIGGIGFWVTANNDMFFGKEMLSNHNFLKEIYGAK